MRCTIVATIVAAAAALQPARSRVASLRRAEPIVSPFSEAQAAVEAAVPAGATALSKEAVDQVLDAVRPYLIADGGNVAVVSVDAVGLAVVLELQGACGSCPSSTVTMKQGIEKVLNERWPGILVQRAEDIPEDLTKESVAKMMAPIANAVKKLGATAAVKSAGTVGPGIVEIEFDGPANVRFGIDMTLKDNKLITEVRWVLPGE
ncbi:NifU-like domain-containing protein [Pelagophyceae sp. CCMP2097]|nr:NifU-like domain-containing protein [Pelagophyceae sp. CCMP2097]